MQELPGRARSSSRSAAGRSSAWLAVVLLSCASGAISLGYQVMWFRLYAERFGSTGLTFLLVLVGFIGGLGLGALASERLSPPAYDYFRSGADDELTALGLLDHRRPRWVARQPPGRSHCCAR